MMGVANVSQFTGKRVRVHPIAPSADLVEGAEMIVQNFVEQVFNKKLAQLVREQHPSALHYVDRVKGTILPVNEFVLYGGINGKGYIVHEYEIGDVLDG